MLFLCVIVKFVAVRNLIAKKEDYYLLPHDEGGIPKTQLLCNTANIV